MVSLMCNSMQDVEAAINNALCASASLRLRVEFGNKNAKTRRREGAKKKSPCVGDHVVWVSIALVFWVRLTIT